MKNSMLLPLLIFSILSADAQGQKKQINRYGFAIINKQGKIWVYGTNRIRKIYHVNPDTIPGWMDPYTYVPTLKSEDFDNCNVTNYVYKEHTGYSCRMDTYLPKGQGDGPFPYLMFIHGGGWKNGNEKYMKNFASWFASHGIATVSVSYTLIPQGDFKTAYQDLLDAKTFVEQHAAQWKIDTARFGFAGVSAGGHLSAFMAMTVPDTRVLISICGPHDLTGRGPHLTPLSPDKIAYFGTSEDNLKQSSPIYRIPDNPPAAMLIHGTFDLNVSPEQSRRFAKALQKKGDKDVELLLVPYAPHAVVSNRVASYEQSLQHMLRFARKHLK